MNEPSSPRPPKWPFLLGDAALLTAAFVIGYFDTTPLSGAALTAIVACVGLGVVLGVLPFLLDFATAQRAADAALRAKLEAENHKLHHAAELIAGAASNLKSVQESTHRAVHAAESLPYRVQEKIGEFTAQLQQIEDDDKAALEKEIELLREAEGEKLGAVADKIRAATKEFSALEKEVRPALEAAMKQSRELEESLKSATSAARIAMLGAEAKVKTAENSARTALEAIEQKLAARIAELRKLEADSEKPAPRRRHETPVAPQPAEVAPPAPAPEAEAPATAVAAPVAEEIAPAAVEANHVSIPVTVSAAPETGAPAAEPAPVADAAPAPVVAPVARKHERRAVARLAAFPDETPAAGSVAVEESPAAPPRRELRRKSTMRSVDDSALPGFADHEIVYDDALAPGAPTAAKTSDGTTRLLVTAYIGIGNKVFVRGDGPGLSWEQGVPLDFISIGKWAWHAAESAGPIRVQLYKNDETKALGEPLVLEPGHHVEVRPVFREPDPF